jgi:hypothetical protein
MTTTAMANGTAMTTTSSMAATASMAAGLAVGAPALGSMLGGVVLLAAML